MYKIVNVFVICSVLAIARSGVLDIPNRCSLTDGDCKKLMYQKMFRQSADGVPSLNIPKADPMTLEHTISTLPNSVKLILEDGTVTGFKNCDFNQMETFLEDPFHSNLNLTCDIEINGKYTVEVPKSVMAELGGEDAGADVITGSGKGQVTMEKLHLLLEVPFGFEWKNNDAYLVAKHLDIKHDAHDTVVFLLEDLDVGNKVNAEKISNYLKEQAIELNLISPVTDKMLEFFQAFVENYLKNVPINDLFTTDVTNFA